MKKKDIIVGRKYFVVLDGEEATVRVVRKLPVGGLVVSGVKCRGELTIKSARQFVCKWYKRPAHKFYVIHGLMDTYGPLTKKRAIERVSKLLQEGKSNILIHHTDVNATCEVGGVNQDSLCDLIFKVPIKD